MLFIFGIGILGAIFNDDNKNTEVSKTTVVKDSSNKKTVLICSSMYGGKSTELDVNNSSNGYAHYNNKLIKSLGVNKVKIPDSDKFGKMFTFTDIKVMLAVIIPDERGRTITYTLDDIDSENGIDKGTCKIELKDI